MKKILITIMGLLLILSLFSFSDIASAKTKKSVKKKSFTVHNVYKIYYSKVDSKTTGVITETGPDVARFIRVGYSAKVDTLKNAEKAKKNAKLFLNNVVKNIKPPKNEDDVIIIQYGEGECFDRSKNFQTFFNILLNKNSYNILKENKGDFTKLDKQDYSNNGY